MDNTRDKDIKNLEKQLRAVQRCSGDCAHCDSCHFHSADTETGICFAFSCDKAPALGIVSERPSKMKEEVLEALRFELKVASRRNTEW